MTPDSHNQIPYRKLETPSDVICWLLKRKQERNKKYSMRAFARDLGFKNPSYLSDVIRGRRRPNANLITGLQSFGEQEGICKRWVETLFLKHSARTESERALHLSELENLQIQNSKNILASDFHLISAWYNLVVLEMFSLKGFKLELQTVYKLLDKAVSRTELRNVLRHLKKLGLVKRDKNGIWKRVEELVLVQDKPGSHDIRSYHKQMLLNAMKALESISPSQTDFRGSIFGLKESDIPKARLLIKRFHKKMRELSCENEADYIYRFGTDFFPLTTKPKENV